MKLTIEQIQFIDDKLRKAGIHYADVRMEMTDHVASALEETEGDFHQNFMVYLARHKYDMNNSYSIYRKKAISRAYLFLVKQLKMFWFVVPVFMIISFSIAYFASVASVSFWLYMVNMFTASIVGYYLWYYRMYKKQVYSTLEKLLFIILIASVFFRIRNFEQGNLWSLGYFSFGTSLLVIMLISCLKLSHYYKTRYAA